MTKRIFAILVRIALVFGACVALQFIVYYPYLVGVGLLAGVFIWFTGDDRPLAYGLIAGSILFAVFAYLYGTA
jgi:hypothetical protein